MYDRHIEQNQRTQINNDLLKETQQEPITIGVTFCNMCTVVNNNKQDRQCTWNVTMRRFRVTVVAVEEQ
jgi:hypothetical protein